MQCFVGVRQVQVEGEPVEVEPQEFSVSVVFDRGFGIPVS